MAAESNLATPKRRETPNEDTKTMSRSTSPPIEHEFDASQCLFCNQTSPDTDQNVLHMSKTHGFYLDTTNLLVEIESLLAYFHLIVADYHECLYCGTQRSTRQAAQQHMMGKGHCKYDLADEDSELREFYDLPLSDEREDVHQRLATRSSEAQIPSRKPRPSRTAERHHSPISASSSHLDAKSDAETAAAAASAAGPSSLGREVSTRALKQEHTLHAQLARLRADDRRSLVHLPIAQRRALLASHHKQEVKAQRTEQAQRGRLESAGNTFGRLDTVRLIRQPPHFGGVSSLKR